MTHESIKVAFSDAVHHVASNISSYAADSDKDLIRNRKIGADKLLSFMVSCGSSVSVK